MRCIEQAHHAPSLGRGRDCDLGAVAWFITYETIWRPSAPIDDIGELTLALCWGAGALLARPFAANRPASQRRLQGDHGSQLGSRLSAPVEATAAYAYMVGDQRDWVALQGRLRETLQSSGHVEPVGPLSEQDADFLADSLADDAYAMFDLTPRGAGVGSRAGDKPRGWLNGLTSR